MKKYEFLGHTKHRKRTKTYLTWRNMISRCYNSNRPDFKYYGGRGIVVCDAWKLSFGQFLSDMGIKPRSKQLDRMDNSKGYEPSNCRWVSKMEQMQNTRGTRLISWNGITMGLNAWARKIGINKESLRTRLANWTLEKSLTTPKTK